MPKTTTNCPRCRQPILADIEQLFDSGVDPQAKQRLLSGQFNQAKCQNCGYSGVLSAPIVYHDPSKELLLTYFPPELHQPVNEQERLIGPLISRVVNKLPAEKRKAYLLRPQTMLTIQTLIERILESDGITREMIDTQQKRLNLLQRLMTSTPETRTEIIRQEEKLMDQEFFVLLNRLIEATVGEGDQQTARQLASVQNELLTQTPVGRELKEKSQETEAAIKSLQEAGKGGMTREKLLKLLIDAPNETRLTTLVSYARSVMDYQFFQLLTEQIEKSQGEQRKKLEDLREKLLQMIQEIDKAIQAELDRSRQLLESILASPNVEEATVQKLDEIGQLFVEVVKDEEQKARQKADLERISKIGKVISVLQKASAPPPEITLIEKLLDSKDDADRRKIIQENPDLLTPEFQQVISGLISQSEQQKQSPELIQQLMEIQRLVVRLTMEKNLQVK